MNPTTTVHSCRNFYLIGHRCNSFSQINKALQQKVNGIECDLWADKEKRWWVSHNGFDKTDLVQWLRHIEKAEQRFEQQLALVVFDIKSAEPISTLREIINDNLSPDLSRMYSTAKISKAHIFEPIVPMLTSKEVVAVDEEDDPKEVAAFFQMIGATQCWYGNGITLIPSNDPYHRSMHQAAPIRDAEGPFSKIYSWSIHRKKELKKYIVDDKVDGLLVGLNNIFTSPVSHALKIIKDHKEIQLADRNSPLF